jgi:hypothetical protein
MDLGWNNNWAVIFNLVCFIKGFKKLMLREPINEWVMEKEVKITKNYLIIK